MYEDLLARQTQLWVLNLLAAIRHELGPGHEYEFLDASFECELAPGESSDTRYHPTSCSLLHFLNAQLNIKV
jgi:hypothetical protein